jgi:hypothetical protein
LENVGIFYGHSEYLTAIWYILCPFGAFCGHLVHIFFTVWVSCTKKNLVMAIWNILCRFGIFYDHLVLIWYVFPGLVSCTKKNLATLIASIVQKGHWNATLPWCTKWSFTVEPKSILTMKTFI